jgi:hypothetical protein
MQMQRHANRGLWIELGVWLTLAAGAFYLSFSFDQRLDVYRFGAAAWPRALIAALAIGALVQFALTWYARRLMGFTVAQGYWARLKESGLAFSLKIGGTFATPLLYVYLLPRTGFYVTTPFFLAGYMYLMGERRALHLLGSTLVIYGLSLLIFTTLLFVALPVGNWPGFYDFSNWLLIRIR